MFPLFHNKDFGHYNNATDLNKTESIMEFRCNSKKIDEFQTKKTGRFRNMAQKFWSTK